MDERWFCISLTRLDTHATIRAGGGGRQGGLFFPSIRTLCQNYLVDVIDQEIEELVGILLHVIVELFLFLPKLIDNWK